MKLNRKQRIVGFFILIFLIPPTLVNYRVGRILEFLAAVLSTIADFCFQLDALAADKYKEFIMKIK